ncbi:hypothetical protein Tco_0421054 [Tanacetum coccineum]
MTDAQLNQETGEVQVTLTTEPSVVQQQSSFVSSDLVSKFINPSPDTDEMNVAVQLKSNTLREEAQAENDEFLKQIDSNIKNIIKDQVKGEVSKILPKIEKYFIDTLEGEVLKRSSNQPQSSYAAAASLTEFELKKIIIDKIEENKSMNRSDVQNNLYNALIESYNSDKDILTSYGDVVTLKRERNDQDKDEEPSVVSNRGSKRRRSGKEESSKDVSQKESRSTSSSKCAPRSLPKSSSKFVLEDEHGLRDDNLEEPFHQEFDTGNDDIPPVKEVTNVDERLWNLKGTPYPHDLSKPLPLILDGRGRQIILYNHFINKDLEYIKGGSSSRKYTTSITKTKAADYGHVKWIEDKIPKSTWSSVHVVYDKHAYWGTHHWGPKRQRFYGYATNMETSEDIYSRHMIIAVTSLKIMEFVGKLTNLNVDERFALNVALRMFTRRIVIQERMEDLQLAIESYQKKINLTKPDTYCSDLRNMTPYTAYRDI